MLRGAELLNAVRSHVMIGEQQAVRGHKGSRAVRDAHRGCAQRLQELVGDFVVVTLLHQILGELVEQPHPFIGAGGRSGQQAEQYRRG
jgi:hypothetical protein